MKVAEIWIYPIKSLGGIKIDFSKVLESGLEWDRRWMIVDENNRFVSQREFPALTQIGVRIENDVISIFQKSDFQDHISFNANEKSETLLETKIWRTTTESYAVSLEVDKWLSGFLDAPVRLVTMNEENPRTRSLVKSPYKTSMNYSDGYPFLFLSRESVNELSQDIGFKVEYLRFRPNILLEECNPFEEDTLKNFQINDTEFNMIKPCVRCKVITLDPDTGESKMEILSHLAGTRKQGNGVVFGMNAALLQQGTINVGDKVVVK